MIELAQNSVHWQSFENKIMRKFGFIRSKEPFNYSNAMKRSNGHMYVYRIIIR
jgi:hypothetical protein